jgi:hypothetical protein
LAANGTQDGFRLFLVSLADGRTEGVPVGCYLARFDPEAADGNGAASWTDDPAQAMTFETAAAAAACYRTVPRNRPLRPDGKPNRPLTTFNVFFE